MALIPVEKWRWIRPLHNARFGQRVCAMQVAGDGLVALNIIKGDVLIFAFETTPEIGDLCVVQVPAGITARVFQTENTWLEPGVIILGVVKRVERDL